MQMKMVIRLGHLNETETALKETSFHFQVQKKKKILKTEIIIRMFLFLLWFT